MAEDGGGCGTANLDPRASHRPRCTGDPACRAVKLCTVQAPLTGSSPGRNTSAASPPPSHPRLHTKNRESGRLTHDERNTVRRASRSPAQAASIAEGWRLHCPHLRGAAPQPTPSSTKYDGTAPVVGRPTTHEPHPNPTPPIQPLLTSSPLLDQSYPCPTPHLHQARGLRPPCAPAQLIASRASVSVCLGLYRPGPGTAFGLMARKRSAL